MNALNLSTEQIDRLVNLTNITADQTKGFTFANNAADETLVNNGLAICNKNQTDTNGNWAIKATDAGFDYLASMEAAQSNQAASQTQANDTMTEAPKFAIEDNVAIPKVKRQAVSNSIYPFDALKIGQSFFVPQPETKPGDKFKDIAKSLASTVSSAQKRYGKVVGKTTINRRATEEMAKERNVEVGAMVPVEVDKYEYDRKFTVRSVTETHNGVEVKGARIWRTELDADNSDDNGDNNDDS